MKQSVSRDVAGCPPRSHRHLFALGLIGLLFLTPLSGYSQTQKKPSTVGSSASAPASTKVTSAGTFADKEGTKHSWQISPAHALIWDGSPYLPVGGSFSPHSFLSPADAAWQEDVKALTMLKGKGLRDLLLMPGKPIADIPTASLQRLIDYLDANDFHYGLSFGSGLTMPLTGTVVKPGSYRIADVRPPSSANWPVTNADSGFYVLVEKSDDNKVRKSGVIPVKENVASVPVEIEQTSGDLIALLFPHKSLPVTNEGSLPDIWSGFDDYRDHILSALSKIKLGKGFRFFDDPLGRRIGLLGESDYMIPDSSTFNLEWEGYITRKYPNVEDARIAWGIGDALKTHRELARLIPLWANTRGIPFLHDIQTRKTYRLALDGSQSRWWQDFLECRNESILYHMNALADLLKSQIADVPVVYTWTQTHPIFCNISREGGFDGLGVAVKGGSLIGRILGPAYSAAEQAERTTWCVATEIVGDATLKPAAPTESVAGQISRPAPVGYASRTALFRDLDTARRVGFKGLFADGFQLSPGRSEGEWLNSPESLDWLQDYSANRVGRESNAAGYAPYILFYPQMSPGPARVGQVPGTEDVLWLNSFYPGEKVDWWPLYGGYVIQRGDEANSQELVLMSLAGKRETHLWVMDKSGKPDLRNIQAFAPDGKTPVPFRITGKNVITITLEETPTIFHTNGMLLIPQEAAEAALVQLNALYARAVELKIPSVENSRGPLDFATTSYKQKDFERAYVLARGEIDRLAEVASPYIWKEGESPYLNVHTFSEVAANAEASGGGYLRLSTPNPPNKYGYGVVYDFDVNTDGRYEIWLSGTVPGPGTSPIKWRLNSDPVQDPTGFTPSQQPLYLGERFGWTQLGTVNLKKGKNVLRILVTDRALSPPEYIFSIDALLITPRPFVPNGTVKPLPIELSTIRRKEK